MKKLLFISLILFPIICFGQKSDSIVYCEVCITHNDFDDWQYKTYSTNKDKTLKYDISDKYTSEIAIFQELGSKGWHFTSILPVGDRITDQQVEHAYLFEKVYKKD